MELPSGMTALPDSPKMKEVRCDGQPFERGDWTLIDFLFLGVKEDGQANLMGLYGRPNPTCVLGVEIVTTTSVPAE